MESPASGSQASFCLLLSITVELRSAAPGELEQSKHKNFEYLKKQTWEPCEKRAWLCERFWPDVLEAAAAAAYSCRFYMLHSGRNRTSGSLQERSRGTSDTLLLRQNRFNCLVSSTNVPADTDSAPPPPVFLTARIDPRIETDPLSELNDASG